MEQNTLAPFLRVQIEVDPVQHMWNQILSIPDEAERAAAIYSVLSKVEAGYHPWWDGSASWSLSDRPDYLSITRDVSA